MCFLVPVAGATLPHALLGVIRWPEDHWQLLYLMLQAHTLLLVTSPVIQEEAKMVPGFYKKGLMARVGADGSPTILCNQTHPHTKARSAISF